MLIAYAIGLLVGGLAKITPREHLKYLAISYFVLMFLLNLVFTGGANLGVLVLILVVKSFFVYGWAILLQRFEDTIFTYLLLLLVGAIALNLF